jgi:hypothetical protein
MKEINHYAKVFAFVDTFKAAAFLEERGFEVEIDDALNNVFYAEKCYATEDEMMDDSISVPKDMGMMLEVIGADEAVLYWEDDCK